MAQWDDKAWHHLVHDWLGERLYYYLARVRPFDSEVLKQQLNNSIDDMKLGGIRVFAIHGLYDLLIRAWLHPGLEATFRTRVQADLKTRGPLEIFAVNRIENRWYWHLDDRRGERRVDHGMLETLDEERIRRAQQPGTDLGELTKANLVIPRPTTDVKSSPTIRFFVGINFEKQVLAFDTVVDMLKHLQTQFPEIKFPSMYRGYGFCSLLLKGQVEPEHYFNVAKLTTWISTTFKDHGTYTETYLAHDQYCLAGNEAIGEATLRGIGGKNLFVQSIIPEIYDPKYSPETVEDFVLKVVKPLDKELSKPDRRLIREYLLAHLERRPGHMRSVLFGFVSDIESYLQEASRDFVGQALRRGFEDVAKEAGLREGSSDQRTLGNMLRVLQYAAKLSGSNVDLGGLDSLGELRNDIVHGRADFAKDWDKLLERFLKVLPQTRRFLHLIEQKTNKHFAELQ